MFPPSSPLLSHQPDIVEGWHKGAENPVGYPTPNPSSSTGLTSPVKLPSKITFDISPSRPRYTLSQTHPQTVLAIPMDGTSIVVGRSSKSCLFVPNRQNKQISRTHARISYDFRGGRCVIECFGHNGLSVFIPKKATVSFAGSNFDYMVFPKPNVALNSLKAVRRVEQLNDASSVFILAGERVTFPKTEGAYVDFRGDVVGLNFESEDDVTEDETELSSENKDIPEIVNCDKLVGKECDEILVEKIGSSGLKSVFQETEEFERLETMNMRTGEEVEEGTYETPNEMSSVISNEMSNAAPACDSMESKSIARNEPTDKGLEEGKDAVENTISRVSIPQGHRAPLQDVTNTSVKRQKKSTSPSPQNERAQNYANLTDGEVGEVLAEIESIEQVKRVLVNHLAFSRLSSTPITDLQGISKSTQALTPKQMRVLLTRGAPGVGVIYREGKDAAGKPLDEEYFYDIDKDDDRDRVNMVNTTKGRATLRNCRKKHKQYYWKRPAPIKKL